jgi:hypothetical protein
MVDYFRLLKGYTNIVVLGLNTVQVNEGRRTLRAVWTPEMVQDLQMFGIDAEAELTALLSEEIARTIDAGLVRGLISNELVPIQPLSAPTPNLFYFDYQYGTKKTINNYKLLRG